MPENHLKTRILEDLKKAKGTGEITVEKMHEIIKTAVSDALAETGGGIEKLRPVVKDAMTAAIEHLRDTGEDGKKIVSGVVEGAVAGAQKHGKETVESIHQELYKLQAKLDEEKRMLGQSLMESFEGAKEAGAALPEDIKEKIDVSVSDIKLKSTELLGLTKEIVKEAVKQTIEHGKDVKQTVEQIAGDTAKRALEEGHLSSERVKKIAEKILSGAVEAAEETGKEIKDVTSGAFEGAQKGIVSIVEAVGDKTKIFINDDLEQTKKDLGEIEELFLDAARKVANRSGEVAGDVLHKLVDKTKTGSSILEEKTKHAAESITKKLKESGKDAAKATAQAAGKAAHVVAEEAKELGKKSLTVAKGAISGMWKGAKDALKKE